MPDVRPVGQESQPSGREKRDVNMADDKVPVFISFDYDHDATLKEFLVGQAKNDD